MPEKSDILSAVCQTFDLGGTKESARILTREYPVLSAQLSKRAYTKALSLKVFRRDGFIDRYSGKKLVFPGVLRLLSILMPREFPFHPNWKVSQTHPAYWELFPTIDHVIPIAHGGADDESNMVTTSMLLNNAKSNWSLDELGWSLYPNGKVSNWDGLLPWFMARIERDRSLLNNNYIKQWHAASQRMEAVL